MAFTTGNDINILQGTDLTNVGAGAGDDRYVLTAATLNDNQAITISDAQGANTLQLVGGLEIVSSKVAADAVLLTLNNGAVITVLGAASFNFQTGGDSLSGVGGSVQNYSDFVTSSLGLAAVPTAAEGVVEVGSVTVNAEGGTTTGSTPVPTEGQLTQAADNLTGTTGDDAYAGLLSTTATSTTFNATDSIIDTTTTDNDVLTLAVENDVTAATSGTIRNIETIKVNADATTLGGDTELAFAATNFTGVKTFEFDVTKAVSAVSKLNVTAVNNDSTVVASDNFSTIAVTGSAATDNVTVDVKATGTSGTPVDVNFGTGTDLVVTGAGDLKVTATSTGLLQATAEKGLTVDSATTNVHIAEAKDGNLTVDNADAAIVAQYTATGNVSVNDTAAGKLTVNAGGTVSLAGTLSTTSATLSATGTSTSAAVAGLATLDISGNGAAAVYDLTAGSAALKDLTVSGDQDVTLQLGATNAILNVYDTATAGDFTLELGTAGSVDLRKGLVDRLELDVDNTGNTLSVKTGQNVTVTADQTGGTLTSGTAAAVATNTLTVTLDDETRDANAVDLDTVTITQAKNVTIDASVDSTSTGAAVTHTIDALTASAANSDVALTMGANNLILDGAVTVGTGNITVTGSGTINDATTTLTANTLDASAVTGAVTLDATTLNVANIKTGSAADTVVLTNDNGGVFELNAGNDSLTLNGGSLAEKTTVINMGEGTDTLNFAAGSKLIAGTAGSVSVSGIENIVFANGANQEIQGSALNGQTYNISSASASNINTITVAVGSTATAVDLSQLVGSTTTATAVTGMVFNVDASANTSTIDIKGVTNADNIIAGSSTMDTLTGGSSDDIFDYADADRLFNSEGVMQDTIAGGANTTSGVDAVRLTAGSALTVANTDVWSKISGVEAITAGASTAAISLALDVSAQTAGITKVDLSGDTDLAAVNVVDASEYTSSITITGALTTGEDNLTGGSGNDTFVYAATADAVNTNVFEDTINGGAGTDTLLIGASAAGVDLVAADSFARVSNVESITALKSTDGYSVALHANAWTAGIRTVDLSAADYDAAITADASVIDVSAIVGGDMTLTGSTAGATTFTGGAGADTMTGGAGNDTFNVGVGKDIIKFAASAAANGSDTITVAGADTTVGADAVVYDFSAFLGSGYSILGASGIDTSITGLTAAGTGDVDLTGKLAVLSVANAATSAVDIDTTAELFALIDGTGDTFALTSGKAVVAVLEASSATGADDAMARFFMIDTAADGTAGLSVSDITLVGTANNIDDASTGQFVFTTDNFA